MPLGSRACFTVRWSSRASFDTACGHQRFLARPMPCSPVMTPPQAMTWPKSSSSAALVFFSRGGSGPHDVDVDVAVAGVAEAGHLKPYFFCKRAVKPKRSSSRPRGTTMSSLNLVRPVAWRESENSRRSFQISSHWAVPRLFSTPTDSAGGGFLPTDFSADGIFLAVEFDDEMGAAPRRRSLWCVIARRRG